jgi:hypothetical protein
MQNTLENNQAARSLPNFPLVGLAPATLAVLVQTLAIACVFITVLVVNFYTPLYFSMVSLVLLQSLFATTICIFARMASWWRWIHFCFPIALFGMSMWPVPNEVYLAGFLISLSLFWTTFRSQVPFFPSLPVVWKKVAELIPQNKSIRIIEIGSGLGDMAMHIAKAREESRIEGIEIAPLPWLISILRAYFCGSRASFKLGDYRELDFAQYDVVFAYLSPAAMPALWDKACTQMRSGSLLISYEFEIPGVKPTSSIASGNRSIYVWKI